MSLNKAGKCVKRGQSLSIPFSLSIPDKPVSLEEMDDKTFNAMLEEGYRQALNGETRPASEVFADIRKRI